MHCMECYLYIHPFVRHLEYFIFFNDAKVAYLGFFIREIYEEKRNLQQSARTIFQIALHEIIYLCPPFCPPSYLCENPQIYQGGITEGLDQEGQYNCLKKSKSKTKIT